MKVNDYITYVGNEEDRPFLKQPLFDVNMRLFASNPSYRRLVKQCCGLIRVLALTKFEDYKKNHGISGANVAIPFNIIGIVRNRGLMNEHCQVMINPKITAYYGPQVESQSNCGSLRLPDPITISRPEFIDLEWFDENGHRCTKSGIGRGDQSLTIQHEVDHNLGILITDNCRRSSTPTEIV
jgi:peptide deformylase